LGTRWNWDEGADGLREYAGRSNFGGCAWRDCLRWKHKDVARESRINEAFGFMAFDWPKRDQLNNPILYRNGFKKALNRATVQVMQSVGQMEKTVMWMHFLLLFTRLFLWQVDKDFEEEEKRFKM
jgi:hypothetical protein